MRRPILFALVCGLAVVASGSAAAQDTLYSYVLRCAVGGSHLPGCAPSVPSCTFLDYFQGTCGSTPTDPVPEPEPDPEPPPATGAPAAPANLRDVTTGILASHDGLRTDWFTLKLDGVYHAHVGMAGFAEGDVLILFGELAPGTYTATVEACSDAAGCTASAPLQVTR